MIGAFALGVIGLLSFGGISFFHKPQRFVVDFDESIHGLDLGSPVKLRGVRVGRVVDLSVRFDQVAKRSVVSVFCEFNRSVITDAHGVELDVSDPAAIQHLVDEGLRAQLGILGLATGLLYVELDFAEPPASPSTPAPAAARPLPVAGHADARPQAGAAPSPATGARRYVVVPALRSTLAELQVNFTELLANLKGVDLAGLSQDLRALTVSTRVQIEALATEWRGVGSSLQALLSQPEAATLLPTIDETLTELRHVLVRLDEQLDSSGQGLDAALVEARTTLESLNAASLRATQFIETNRDLGEEATLALRRLADAAAAAERLADTLSRNPNALLVGKKKEPK